MNKMYVITSTDKYSDGDIVFDVIGVYNSIDLAKEKLEELKQQDIEYYVDNGREEEDLDIRPTCNGFMFDFFDEFTRYEIVEKELNK